jgi:hypothetical protein
MATGFWSSTALEPKRQFRFKVEFQASESESANALTSQGVIWFAKKATLPQYTMTEVTHKFLDKNFYFPGRIEYNTVELVLVDPVSPDAVDLTLNMIEDSGYRMPSSMDKQADFHTISKNKASKKGLGDVIITTIDHEGNTLEKWTLNSAFPKSVKFGDLSYDSDELREITLEIRYDWATCDMRGDSSDDYFKAGLYPTTGPRVS